MGLQDKLSQVIIRGSAETLGSAKMLGIVDGTDARCLEALRRREKLPRASVRADRPDAVTDAPGTAGRHQPPCRDRFVLEARGPETSRARHFKRVAQRTIENIQDVTGYFYQQKHERFVERIPCMLWGQAWMMFVMIKHLIAWTARMGGRSLDQTMIWQAREFLSHNLYIQIPALLFA